MQLSTLTPLQIQQLIVAIIGGVAFVLIIVLFVRMRRRIASDQLRLAAQAETDAVLRGFRSRLNYASQLLSNERERMRYDRVRYSSSDAETMAGFLQEAETRYQNTNSALERAIRQLPDHAEIADFRTLMQKVQELTPTIAPIEAALQQSIHHRSIIDMQIQQCNEQIESVQREQQQLQHRLATLGINHRGMLVTTEQAVTRANELFAAHQYDDARATVTTAKQAIQTINSQITLLLDVRNGVMAGRQAAEKAALQGFDVQKSLALLQQASTILDTGLATLMSGKFAESERLFNDAETLRQQAVNVGGSQPVLYQRLNETLSELLHAGDALRTQFQQAALAFQHLKHAHALLWDDVMHAGSEATINAHYAAYYVTYAQKMLAAKRDTISTELLDAQYAITRANHILQVIIQRYDDIQRMELIARQEYADAEELIDLVQTRVNAKDAAATAYYPAIKQEFMAVQQCMDEVPFNSMSSYRMARLFIQRTVAQIPIEEFSTPLFIAERSQRIRDMLWRQIRMLEQFTTLHQLPEGDTLVRGIQSIRHEANSFDVTWTTASDMTVPIIGELSKLTQRYDRLDNAIVHISKQLRHAIIALRKKQIALFGALNSTITRIRMVADAQIRMNALQRLRELDNQLTNGSISHDALINELIQMKDALPHDPLDTKHYDVDPFPYLHMRYFAKTGAFELPPPIISWIPNLPADPDW